MRLERKEGRQPAFTLIELLVVLSIIAILAVLLVPRLVNYSGQAREAAAIQNAQAVVTAAELYTMDSQHAADLAKGISLDSDKLQPYLKMPKGAEVTFKDVFVSPTGDVQGQVTTKNVTVDLSRMEVVEAAH
ncbi:prepilin-type N-terminal cleavage/methylation domain-containing protein [Peptococcus simiae]|uniref:prepilin-type N-terminal cleavage/methylation domain-containing protein n=1 Tax=Peptococcus simiae TaxID=1643805 RepID=UPI003980965E